MICKTRVIDNYTVRIIHDFHRNMWIGKFENGTIDNVYGDTEGEVYKEIHNAIAKHQGLPIPYPDDED